MGKHKDYITIDITIEQAVNAMVRSSGDDEETVIIALANYILVKGFHMSYEHSTIKFLINNLSMSKVTCPVAQLADIFLMSLKRGGMRLPLIQSSVYQLQKLRTVKW